MLRKLTGITFSVLLMFAIAACLHVLTRVPAVAATPGTKPVSATPSVSATEGLRLLARVDKTTVQVGQPIIVHLTIKNVTKRSVQYWEANLNVALQVFVKNKRGATMPLTRFGSRMAQGRVKAGEVFLKPGESRQFVVQANRLVDMTEYGTYFITARRRYLYKVHGTKAIPYELVSNTVSVKVTPQGKNEVPDEENHLPF